MAVQKIKKCEKLLKIEFDKDKDILKSIKITGDFFIYPEDALEEMEKLVTDCSISDIESKLGEFIKNKKIKIIGFTVKDLVELLK